MKSMHRKYQLSGIPGCILHPIKLKKNMNWINTIGKNHISLTRLVLKMHIIQIKIKKMLDKKNIEAGNLIKLFINFIIYIFFVQHFLYLYLDNMHFQYQS